METLVSVSVISRFYGSGIITHRLTPTWRARESLFVWSAPFDLFDMGGPTRSFTSADIALEVIETHRLSHRDQVVIPSG